MEMQVVKSSWRDENFAFRVDGMVCCRDRSYRMLSWSQAANRNVAPRTSDILGDKVVASNVTRQVW